MSALWAATPRKSDTFASAMPYRSLSMTERQEFETYDKVDSILPDQVLPSLVSNMVSGRPLSRS